MKHRKFSSLDSMANIAGYLHFQESVKKKKKNKKRNLSTGLTEYFDVFMYTRS